MQNRVTLRGIALVTALGAASAWAYQSLPDATWIPAPRTPIVSSAPPVRHTETIVDEGEIPVPAEPAPRIERVTPLEAAAIPPIPASPPQPRIIVEERRLTLDERIQADLAEKLAQAPGLSGKVGVESHEAVVTLSGWTTTSGQAQRVVRYAWNVPGVKDVQNGIRPRVGGSM